MKEIITGLIFVFTFLLMVSLLFFVWGAGPIAAKFSASNFLIMFFLFLLRKHMHLI